MSEKSSCSNSFLMKVIQDLFSKLNDQYDMQTKKCQSINILFRDIDRLIFCSLKTRWSQKIFLNM